MFTFDPFLDLTLLLCAIIVGQGLRAVADAVWALVRSTP